MMMKWIVDLTPKAKKDIRSLDTYLRKRIIEKLEFYAGQECPFLFAAVIKNRHPVTHRFRVGDYRGLVSFDEEKKSIVVYRVGHRNEIYSKKIFV